MKAVNIEVAANRVLQEIAYKGQGVAGFNWITGLPTSPTKGVRGEERYRTSRSVSRQSSNTSQSET